MPLTVRTNGSGSGNIVTASWWNDYHDLLTGSMQDQEVTVKNNVVLEAIGPAPASALSGVLTAGTVLGVGAYTYTFTFLSADGESTESPTFSITTTTNNQSVNLSAISAGPTGTTARNLYRTAVGGSQRKLLHQIADNTTTTYTDAIADGSLGANAPTSPSFGGSLVLKNASGTITFRIYNDGTFSSGGSGSLGNTTISGTLTVSGATTLQSTLSVTGTSSLDGGNITTNGSGKISAAQLAISSTSTFSAAVTVAAGGLTITAGGLTVSGGGITSTGATSLDGANFTTDGSGNITALITAALSGHPITVNGTSGSATIYQPFTGSGLKLVLVSENGFNNTNSGAITKALRTAFTTGALVFTNDQNNISLSASGSNQTIDIITSLASTGGSSSTTTQIGGWSVGWCGSGFDSIVFAGSNPNAHSGMLLLIGL